MILLIWMTAERHAMISLQTMIYLDAKWMNSLFQSHKILTKKKKKRRRRKRKRKRKRERERERERERDLSHMSSFLLNWQTLIDTSLYIIIIFLLT